MRCPPCVILRAFFPRPRLSLRAGLLGFGLAFAFTDPSLAGGSNVDCVLGSKEPPFRLVAACSAIIDNPATSRLVPTFRSSCSMAANTFTNFGKSWALANYNSSAAFDLKSLGRTGGKQCRDFRSAALDRAAALVVQADAHAHISGGMTKALSEVDRAIELDPNSGDAWRMRGDLTREAGGSLARAEADLSKAIALNPNER